MEVHMQNADFTMFSEKSAAPQPRRRSEIVRMLLFLGIFLGVQAATIWCEIFLYLLLMVVAQQVGFAGDILGGIIYTYILIFVAVGPAIAAALNRRFTFRAKGRWWVSPLVMAGLGLLFGFVGAFLLADVWKLTSSGVAWGMLTALWLIAQYILQRIVLFRNHLDTLP